MLLFNFSFEFFQGLISHDQQNIKINIPVYKY